MNLRRLVLAAGRFAHTRAAVSPVTATSSVVSPSSVSKITRELVVVQPATRAEDPNRKHMAFNTCTVNNAIIAILDTAYMTKNFFRDLEKLRQFAIEKKRQAILIKSPGECGFVAHTRPGKLHTLTAKFPENRDYAREGLGTLGLLKELKSYYGISTIGLIEFEAWDVGFELALALDYRIATAEAKFGFPMVFNGVIPRFNGFQMLADKIGYVEAALLISSGRSISATEALKLGIVDEIVADAIAAVDVLARVMSNTYKQKNKPQPRQQSNREILAELELLKKALQAQRSAQVKELIRLSGNSNIMTEEQKIDIARYLRELCETRVEVVNIFIQHVQSLINNKPVSLNALARMRFVQDPNCVTDSSVTECRKFDHALAFTSEPGYAASRSILSTRFTQTRLLDSIASISDAKSWIQPETSFPLRVKQIAM